jgi:ATP-dependent Clp protease ATP-binding subunit ClpC
MTDQAPICNLSSARAHKARFATHFDNAMLRKTLWLVSLVGLSAWGWLVFFEALILAHLLLIALGLLWVVLLWYSGELKELKPTQSISEVKDISQVLDRQILAKLKSTSSPKDIARIMATQPGGYFFASRFAIGAGFVEQLSSQTPESSERIWQNAIFLTEKIGAPEVDSGIVVAALIYAIPKYDTFLAPIQLDGEDILAGVNWFHHINKVIAYHQERRSYGGIGRDLAFGWAPLLNRVGYNITESIENGGLLRRSVEPHNQVTDQVFHLLAQPGRRNAVLVGEVGVGKTTIVQTLTQKLLEDPKSVPPEVRFNQVITLDAANLIANAKGRGQLEELLIHLFNEAIAAKNIILFLDEAQLFLKDGTGAVDLSNLLLPVIEGGAMRIILSLSDQEWVRLGQNNPGLAQMMNRVIVKPLDLYDTVQVMEDQIILLEAQHKVVYMHQTLKEAYKLADRFIHDQAFPGKAIKLLEAATAFPEQKVFITAKSAQQAVEKSFDVKVQSADTAEERDVLLTLENRIHERMINQTRAVKLVSDALRRARAGVRNESKPIGTFLFLGPTGVGKTELSKSLAAVYFGGEERMVRIDLNEFSQPNDTTRLLATGGTDPYSLCAQIAKQPFSVVLLDEIEKAHPNVLNLLLQLLDEGTLRDAENKPISFRDAIIIATSNAGADRIRAHIQSGQQLEQFEEAFVNELIDSNTFRPEFLNRFDEIILFRPLTTEELMQVVDLLINALNKRLASQKVVVTLTPAAKELLAKTGYDPRLGARPLRRTVQRAVENLVAQRMLSGNVAPGAQLQFDAPEIQAILNEH